MKAVADLFNARKSNEKNEAVADLFNARKSVSAGFEKAYYSHSLTYLCTEVARSNGCATPGMSTCGYGALYYGIWRD